MRLLVILFLTTTFSFAQSVDGTYKTVTATGTNNYVISEALTSPDAYSPKEKWIVTFLNGNTGPITINRNGLGAKSVKKIDGSNLSSGEIPSGGRLSITYNGTYYQVLGSGSVGGTCSTCWQTSGTSNISDATEINILDNGGANGFEIKPQDALSSSSSIRFEHYDDGIDPNIPRVNLTTQVNPGILSQITANQGLINFYSANGSESTQLQFNSSASTSFVFTDSRVTKKGIQYAASGYEGDNLSLTSRGYVLGAKTFTGKQTFLTSTTGSASINIPDGATPTSPSNGDIWGQGNHLFARLNGITYQLDQQTGGTITLSGDVSGSGTTSIVTTIGVGKVTNSMLAGSIDLTSKVSNILPLANGGTGADLSLTGGTGQFLKQTTSGSAVTVGQISLSDLPTLSATSVIGTSGTAGAPNNIGPATAYQILRANSAGTTLQFGSIDLSQSAAVGSSILGTGNGGTGLSSLGTGVQTALGINIGSAGAPVLFNGALGTPSSGTLTNATGLPISGISGLGTGVGTWLATPSWTNFNSAITGTAPYWSLSSGGTLTGANTITGSTSNTIKYSFGSLAATQTDGAGLWLQNSTAAISGTQQYSPSIVLEGQGFGTTGSASQTVKHAIFTAPVQGTVAIGGLSIHQSLNGAAYSNLISFNRSSAGATQILGGLATTTLCTNNSGSPVATMTATTFTANVGLAVSVTSPTSLSANTNNYAIGNGSFFRLTASTPINITGFTGGVDGKFLIIRNVGANAITITHEDANSTAANRVTSSTAANITLNANGSIILVYDATASRWLDFALR